MTGEEITVLTPTGMLGYGIPEDHLRRGIAERPDIITADSGSTDSGPQKLALGSMTCSREAYVTDIGLMLRAGREAGAPVVITSAGGDGSNAHVEVFVDIVREIAAREGMRLRLAAIHADIDKAEIGRRLEAGQVTPCGPVPTLRADDVAAATTIVAQMGAEPFIQAFRERPDLDVIIAGRAYDPAPIAALGIARGFDPGLCWHMGKIMECGALCAEPKGRVILGRLRRDHFELTPLNPAERCTELSVAAHTLYEKSHPWLLPGPGGVLDLAGAEYRQSDARSVRVSGSRFHPSERYAVKLEGACVTGWRSIFIGGIRDPILIAGIDAVLDRVRQEVGRFAAGIGGGGDYQLIFHVYGKNGVMAELEPENATDPIELCVIGEVAAATQERATALCNRARVLLMHLPYPGQLATAGSLASPFTPLEIPLGQSSAFNVYHLMEVDDPTAPFPIRFEEIGA